MLIDEAAERLAAARLENARLDDLPANLRPTTLEEAYAIQNQVARRLGAVGGWKVGAAADGGVLVAPIPASCVRHARRASALAAPATLEAELGLLIGRDLPNGPYAAADVLGAITAAHVVVEVLAHRFVDRAAVSDLTFLADGNGNGGVVIGEVIDKWRDLDFAALDVRLAGVAGSPGDGNGAVHDLLAALATHAARHAGGLKAGQIVITGARAGPMTFPAGPVTASINGACAIVQVV